MSSFSFPGFGFEGSESTESTSASSFELPTFGLGGDGAASAFEVPTFGLLGGGGDDTTEDAHSNADTFFPTFGLGGGNDVSEAEASGDAFEFPSFGFGGGDDNDDGNDADVNYSASGSSWGIPTFGLGGGGGGGGGDDAGSGASGGLGFPGLGLGLGLGDNDEETNEDVNYSASGSSWGLPTFGLGGGDDADSGNGLGLTGLGLGLGLGTGVSANDLMGGNACAWNRRDVTEDFRTSASQLWTSLTQDGAANLGIATVSPMTGQYEENFWLPGNVCEPVIADENSCFVRGETAEYELPCVVQDATEFQSQFTGNTEIVLDFETFNCAATLPGDGLYVVGAELQMFARAEVHIVDELIDEATVDLHKDHFVLNSCEISLRTSDTPLGAGEQFEYILTLQDKQFSMKAILIGSILGGVTLLLMFCFCCWCCCRRRQVKKLVSYGDLESGKRKNKRFKK